MRAQVCVVSKLDDLDELMKVMALYTRAKKKESYDKIIKRKHALTSVVKAWQ